MKKPIFIALALILAAGGAWGSRAAWRAHKDLVTLDVRNMPLAQVIRQLERQTWEDIVVDPRLDTQVTLNVRNLPLADALDRIAEQAGALVTAVHAVYRSKASLAVLRQELQKATPGTENGWTNLAPELRRPPGGPAVTGQPDRMFAARPADVLTAAPGDGPKPDGRSLRRISRSPGGKVVEEIVTPERLVLEARLTARLRNDDRFEPTREQADQTAQQLDAKSTTLYALRKSAVGGPVGRPHRRLHNDPHGVATAKGKTGDPRIEKGPAEPGASPLDNAERGAQRASLSRFANLTPEQRAQRARECSNMMFIEEDEPVEPSTR